MCIKYAVMKPQLDSCESGSDSGIMCLPLQGVTFPCINHAKTDEIKEYISNGEMKDDAEIAASAASRAPKLASFAFRKKEVSKLEELLQVIQHETSSDAGSADASSAV